MIDSISFSMVQSKVQKTKKRPERRLFACFLAETVVFEPKQEREAEMLHRIISNPHRAAEFGQ